MIDNRKLAGILVETFAVPSLPDKVAAAIGVGINVDIDPGQLPADPPGLADRLISLSAVRNAPVDRLLVLSEAIGCMDDALSQTDVGPLLETWRRRCPLLSQWVRLRSDGVTIQGQVIDLDPSAGLIVRTDTGTVVHLPAATTTIL